MARASSIQITGLKECEEQFRKLRGTAMGNDVQNLLLDGVRMIANEAEVNAPVAQVSKMPGRLRRSFRTAKGQQERTFLQAFALSLKDLAPHAAFIAFGTKARGNRPAVKPNRFFQEAVRRKRGAVKRHIEGGLKRFIEAVGRAT